MRCAGEDCDGRGDSEEVNVGTKCPHMADRNVRPTDSIKWRCWRGTCALKHQIGDRTVGEDQGLGGRGFAVELGEELADAAFGEFFDVLDAARDGKGEQVRHGNLVEAADDRWGFVHETFGHGVEDAAAEEVVGADDGAGFFGDELERGRPCRFPCWRGLRGAAMTCEAARRRFRRGGGGS